ncbi:MAG: DUF3105 domain-containing protein [Chloroflexota bacterium]|nr:DUF3105 domain-containing protein [Chloroflexota bacterium]
MANSKDGDRTTRVTRGEASRQRSDQSDAKRSAPSTTASATPPHVRPRRAERRPEMIRERRDQRRQAYEQKQRQWLWMRIVIGVLGVLVLGGIAWGVYSYIQDRNLNVVPDGTRDFQYAASDHTASLEETVAYAESPPVGGRHAPPPYWQNCGSYDQPIRNESAVHSLEHGAVWITYRPDLEQAQVETLREKASQSYVLVSPYPDLPAPVVASSWNHQIQLDSASDERLDQFIRRFKEGPDTPEPGALCSGGVGTPS